MMDARPYGQIAIGNGIRPVLGKNQRLTTAGRWWKAWLRAWSVIARVHCPHRTAVVESGDWMRWECSCGAHGSACPIRGKDGRPAVDADVTRFLAYIGGLQHARAAARLLKPHSEDSQGDLMEGVVAARKLLDDEGIVIDAKAWLAEERDDEQTDREAESAQIV
jgi:hypothetical protein